MSIMLTTPFVMVMLTLIVYFNNGDDFSPDVVFTAVSLLLVIRFPLMMLPMAIAGWVQGKVRNTIHTAHILVFKVRDMPICARNREGGVREKRWRYIRGGGGGFKL